MLGYYLLTKVHFLLRSPYSPCDVFGFSVLGLRRTKGLRDLFLGDASFEEGCCLAGAPASAERRAPPCLLAERFVLLLERSASVNGVA